MHNGAEGLMRVQTAAEGCRRVRSAEGCRSVHEGADGLMRVQKGAEGCIMVQKG